MVYWKAGVWSGARKAQVDFTRGVVVDAFEIPLRIQLDPVGHGSSRAADGVCLPYEYSHSGLRFFVLNHVDAVWMYEFRAVHRQATNHVGKRLVASVAFDRVDLAREGNRFVPLSRK